MYVFVNLTNYSFIYVFIYPFLYLFIHITKTHPGIYLSIYLSEVSPDSGALISIERVLA